MLLMQIHKIKIKVLLDFLGTSLFFFCPLLIMAIVKPNVLHDIFIIILVSIVQIYFSIPLILTITYLIEDFKKTIVLNSQTGVLSVENKQDEIKIYKKDIIDFYYVKGNLVRHFTIDFDYIVIILKERQRIFITRLICNPQDIIDFIGIEPKEISQILPYLDRKIGSAYLTTQEFEEKVKEFIETYKNKSNEELHNICSHSNTYAEYAIAAAKRILENRC